MKTLFCTVGGSPSPIVTAIQTHHPDRVVFVCSEDDPTSGRTGSYEQVLGEGSVCKSSFDLHSPDLPNIPTQAGLDEEAVEVLKVPTDDPDTIIARVGERLEAAVEADGDIVADYTGGTKSMAAGLFFASVTRGVELSLVGGPRMNLQRVQDNVSQVVSVETAGVRSTWALEQVERAWARHAYGEATHLLEDLESQSPQIQTPLALSRAFAAWDAFDHDGARELLRIVAAQVPDWVMPSISMLAHPRRNQRTESLRIWDMWRMSERRSHTGRHDTAVLLMYRVLEQVAQWSLEWHHELDTSDLPEDFGDTYTNVHKAHDGQYKSGLRGAWTILADIDGPLQPVADSIQNSMLQFTGWRNNSVLAHGFEPIGQSEHDQARQWMASNIIPAFLEVAFDGEAPFPQLPTELPG